MWTRRSVSSQDVLWQCICSFLTFSASQSCQTESLGTLESCQTKESGPRVWRGTKRRMIKLNGETDEVLIRISLCWHSVGILHQPHQPSISTPTGRQATSQSALLCGLFNNVEGERREIKWGRKRFLGAVGAPCVTFTSSEAISVSLSLWLSLCVCVCV